MHYFEKRTLLVGLLSLCGLLLMACNGTGQRKAHQLISLRAEDFINGHKVTVTPCATSDHETHRDTSADDSKHVIKCRSAEVVLENEVLSVNGKSYGRLAEKAVVRVENQKVFINDVETQPLAQTAVVSATPQRTVKQKLAKTWRAFAAKAQGTAHQLASN